MIRGALLKPSGGTWEYYNKFKVKYISLMIKGVGTTRLWVKKWSKTLKRKFTNFVGFNHLSQNTDPHELTGRSQRFLQSTERPLQCCGCCEHISTGKGPREDFHRQTLLLFSLPTLWCSWSRRNEGRPGKWECLSWSIFSHWLVPGGSAAHQRQ